MPMSSFTRSNASLVIPDYLSLDLSSSLHASVRQGSSILASCFGRPGACLSVVNLTTSAALLLLRTMACSGMALSIIEGARSDYIMSMLNAFHSGASVLVRAMSHMSSSSVVLGIARCGLSMSALDWLKAESPVLLHASAHLDAFVPTFESAHTGFMLLLRSRAHLGTMPPTFGSCAFDSSLLAFDFVHCESSVLLRFSTHVGLSTMVPDHVKAGPSFSLRAFT